MSSTIAGWDRSPDSRYLDHANMQRADIALFDLLGSINDQNREIAHLLIDENLSKDAIEARVGALRISQLNEILTRAGLLIQLDVTAQQTFMARREGAAVEYPIYKMSDGEKSALLLAAEILTAPREQIIIVDEPERHMHRSISAGMIEAVVAARPDCSFVILTHDLDLAASTSARAGLSIVVRGCDWTNSNSPSWSIELLSRDADLPELARTSILGGRRRVLFVEGVRGGIDVGLYALLFPDWTIVPSGGCESVMRAVKGLRRSDALHWIEAAGLVDGDARSDAERASLFQNGVQALLVHEVENLLYHSHVLNAVAESQKAVFGVNEPLAERARGVAIAELSKDGCVERLAAKIAKDEIVRRFTDFVPKKVDVEDVDIQIRSPYPEICNRIRNCIQGADYDALIELVPVRDTGVRNVVARALKFGSVHDYQSAARARIAQSEGLRRLVLGLVGELPSRDSSQPTVGIDQSEGARENLPY